MRLFIGINIPKKQRERMHRAIRALREGDLPVRWIDPEHYHVTLKFLGEVHRDQVAGVEQAVAKVAKATRPFTTTASGFGAFPTIRRPSVIWLGVGATPELRCLKQDLEWGLAHMPFPAEVRTFHPHVTVGRADEQSGAGVFRELDSVLADLSFSADLKVHSVDLIRSQMSKSGVRYTVVSGVRLEGE
jgi:2'-5' RNA ligase